MADFTLTGNHDTCPACELRREALGRVPIKFGDVPCNKCKGTGFIRLTDREITARMAEDGRLHHWPAFDERNGR